MSSPAEGPRGRHQGQPPPPLASSEPLRQRYNTRLLLILSPGTPHIGHSGRGLGRTGPTGRTCTYFTNGDLAWTGPERRAAAVTAAPRERVNFFSMVVLLCVEAGGFPRPSRIAHSRALCGALRHGMSATSSFASVVITANVLIVLIHSPVLGPFQFSQTR